MSELNDLFAKAVAKHQAGDFTAGEQMYRDILKKYPAHAPTLCNLGVMLVRANKLEEAANCYNLALAASPGHPDAHFNLGNLFRRNNQLREAATHYRECLSKAPNHSSASYNLGLTLAAAGDLFAAVDCFRAVTKLEPQNAEAFGRLGDALARTGRAAEGVTAFRKSVELKPTDPRGLYNLGLALTNAGNTAESHECIQKALKIKPDYAEAHNAFGLNLESMGRKDDALFHYQEAVRLKPNLADAWSNMGTNLSEQGRADDAIRCLRESLMHRAAAPPIHSNLLLMLNYSSHQSPAEIRDEHRVWAELFASPVPDVPPIPRPYDPDRRLRIGYVSADFRAHTVSGFIELLLKNHDRSQVEVYSYASVLRQDDTTEKLKKLSDHWRSVGGVPDGKVYETVRADNLDVLIDLGGHTAGNRMQVLAARPAPIQATLFGYPNTTGMKAVDFRITDPISDPPGATDDLYVEQPLHLPEVAWAYNPPENAPSVTPLPAAGKRQFTFGCLNNSAKISDLCLETWAKILQTVPGTKIVLLAGQSQAGAKRLHDRFVKAGVLRDRVEIVYRLPKDKYFEAYRNFDISLDPFPYNGGVTTADSLWMGVPVMTVAGMSYVSRQGTMVMSTLGLHDFIADSPEMLVQLAKEWTTRRTELAEIRAGLRDNLAKSPLADGPRYVRNLEAALRKVWRERLPK